MKGTRICSDLTIIIKRKEKRKTLLELSTSWKKERNNHKQTIKRKTGIIQGSSSATLSISLATFQGHQLVPKVLS